MAALQDKVRVALEIRDASLEKSAILTTDLATLPLDVTGIPRSSGLMSDSELSLTEDHDATSLLSMLAEKKVSAVELLSAFRKRATIAHQCTNCLTELLPEAIEAAKACDDYLAQTGKVKGLLHGLPVSLKEQYSVGGHRTNGGFVAWVDNVTPEDAVFVTTLKQLGAVIFARTNQPQSLMHLETSNNIYGTTVNPKNRLTTPGGSTGGESALMAMHGSPLGFGGDIGGSIRVPTALTGLYGFMPSPYRFTDKNVIGGLDGNDSIIGVMGPFARSIRDLELFCNAYSSTNPWIQDAALIPGPIISSSLGLQLNKNRPLKIGLLTDDGVLSPLPPVSYVVDRVRECLGRAASVEVVPFTPMNHAKGWSIISSLYFEDEGAFFRQRFAEAGEPELELTTWIIEQCQTNRAALGGNLQDIKDLRNEFRRAYSEYWNQSGVDVVLAPVYPSTASPLGTTRYWAYSAIWNLLNYPIITLPAAKLVGGASLDELKQAAYSPKNELEAHYYKHYSPEGSVNMPVGMQVIVKRWHEGLLFDAAKVIEEALRAE